MQPHRSASMRRLSDSRAGRHRARGAARLGLTIWIYAGLIAASGALFALDMSRHQAARNVRQFVTDLAAPLLNAVSEGTAVAKSWVVETRTYANLNDEVGRLRAENVELRDWHRRALEMEGRARRYEALLNFQPDPGATIIAARAIADIRSPFARSLIINAGAEAGVVEGNAVLGAEGFIGRVVSAGDRSARVLLISDLQSRIPVHVGVGRHRAILAGTNDDEPTLLHVPAGAKLRDGDAVVTSADGHLLPPDIPVGQVRLGAESTITVVPSSDPSNAEFVRIMDYRVPVDVANEWPSLPAPFAETPKMAGSIAPVAATDGAGTPASPNAAAP